MRTVSEEARYPRIRREFATLEEMAEILNRSRSYVAARMVGKQPFSYREKKHLLNYLGAPVEDMGRWFPEEEDLCQPSKQQSG